MFWDSVCEILADIVKGLGSWYPTANSIYQTVGTVIKYITIYQTIYFILGIFFTRKFKRAKKMHKYAVVIAARNEESVIGNLLDSISKQDYPSELLTVFVVADNCTDNTAKVARSHGAVCYERFDNEHKTKGFALQYLFSQIEKDYGTDFVEGYFVFDADNLLKSDYISRMNDSFDAGEKIITSFRNTKNFDEDWIASTYALHWIRSARTNHRPRSFLHLSTNIQGTGFLFDSLFVKDGWKYTSLTEDRAFTADAVVMGYRVSYNDEAVFYDEQPVSLKIALRQRLRWAKGHLLAFVESGPGLFLNIFRGNPRKKGFAEGAIHRFASYDTLVQLTPRSLIGLIKWLFVFVLLKTCYKGAILTLILTVWYRIHYRLKMYVKSIFIAVYLFFIEHRRIKKMPWYKMALYCLTWPTFDIIGRYSTYVALFKKVTWKPIPHNSKVNIDDLNKSIKN
ncbi:MAG: glycosyltransferase family 2 protein [Clostridia bacterium]|nr:glycosyltransferase family 2 protein [Clostridia bacterium]